MLLRLAIDTPITLFEPLFAQRALAAVALISVMSAALGTAIVLRDLPFFTHSIGAGAYPALVLAVAAGVSLALAAVAGGLLFALILWTITRGSGGNADRRDALTGIAVAAALAGGAVLAATVATGNQRLAVPPEALLFGSVLTADGSALQVAAAVAAITAVAFWLVGDRWLAGGFDPGVSRQLSAARYDAVLLIAVALAAAATLPVTGSLMAGAMLVVPAATARLVTSRVGVLAPLTFALTITQGVAGLYLSLSFDLPAGATIAAVTGGGFVIVALGVWTRSLGGSPRTRSVAAPLALVAVAAFAVSGCGGSAGAEDKSEQASEPVKVVATSTQVGDLVKQVGGDVVQVTTLLPAGADPHAYEPKPSAVTAIAAAKVVFRSGGDIDNWLAPAVKAAGDSRPPVDLSSSAVLLKSPGEVFNAHWYLSPENLSAAAQRVRDELIKTAPTARETLRANATTYINRVDATSDALAGCATKLAAKDRVVLTGHNDFDYLTRKFGLKTAGQLTETGESEPSASDVQRAVDRARGSGARALVTSRGEVAQLAVEVAKRLKIPLLGLYSDSLAASGPASTALGAIAYDLGQLVSATSGGAVRCRPAKTV